MDFLKREQAICTVIDSLARRESRTLRFKESFDQSMLPSAIVKISGEFLEVNDSLCEWLGYTKEELLSKTWQELTHKDYVEVDNELVKECVDGFRKGYKLRKKYIHKKGNIIVGYLFVSLIDSELDVFFLSNIFFADMLEDDVCRNGSH